MFEVYGQSHPWVAVTPPQPKSVVRDLLEQAMDFGEYTRYYNLARSEGGPALPHRRLPDPQAHSARDAKSDDLLDLIEWLGELVRQVDSSLLDEWEALRNPGGEPRTRAADRRRRGPHREPAGVLGPGPQRAVPPGRAHRHPAVERAGDLDGDDGWTTERWFEAMAPYFAEYEHLGIDPTPATRRCC